MMLDRDLFELFEHTADAVFTVIDNGEIYLPLLEYSPHLAEGNDMERRVDYATMAPGVRAAMLGLEQYVHQSELERSLVELVDLRASLINGCAYCADMHTKVARSAGEVEQRLYTVSVWRETPFFSDRERAALAWTEAVTRVSIEGVSDEAYESAREEFSEKELVDLTLAIVAINGWNRLAIAFRTVPGTFEIGARPSAEAAPLKAHH